MKLTIRDTKNNKTGEAVLPSQFEEAIRPDLIRRAVHYQQQNEHATYGADSRAGKRSSVRLSKKRHDYRAAYGRGMSRIPRKILTRRGTQFNLEGAFAPGTVGGRRAHPPKAEKITRHALNKKTWSKAMRSALAATLDTGCLKKRNHTLPSSYPFILAKQFETITKTKELENALRILGFDQELVRVRKTATRAGKGKRRGRRQITKKGPLIVVADPCPLLKAGRNLCGCDVVSLTDLGCADLAPGTHPGRLTLYTESALDALEHKGLYLQERPKAKASVAPASRPPARKAPSKQVKTKKTSAKE